MSCKVFLESIGCCEGSELSYFNTYIICIFFFKEQFCNCSFVVKMHSTLFQSHFSLKGLRTWAKTFTMGHEPRCSFYFLLGENSLLACIDEMTVVLKKCEEWLLSTKYKR